MGILSHLAVGLGLSSTAFEALFHPHPLSSLRMLHYPAPEIPPAETESSQSQDDVIYSGHTDSGCVTLLTTFGMYSTGFCMIGCKLLGKQPDLVHAGHVGCFTRCGTSRMQVTRFRSGLYHAVIHNYLLFITRQ